MNTWNSFFAIAIHALFHIAQGDIHQEARQYLQNFGAAEVADSLPGTHTSQTLTFGGITSNNALLGKSEQFKKAVGDVCHWQLRDFLLRQLLKLALLDDGIERIIYFGCAKVYANQGYPRMNASPRDLYTYFNGDQPALLAGLGDVIAKGFGYVDDVAMRFAQVTGILKGDEEVFLVCATLEKKGYTGDNDSKTNQRRACDYLEQVRAKMQG